jgi:hypothetical protein
MFEIHIRAEIPGDILAEVGPEFIEGLLDNLAMAARAKWINLAKAGLHSTSQEYIQGLQEIESHKGVRVIVLAGWLPNALENGLEEFDLRDTILSSPKAKTSADGHKYLAIPFRHATPGTVGQAGPAMGMRYGPQGALSRAWASGGHFSMAEAEMKGKALYGRAKGLTMVHHSRTAHSGATTTSIIRRPGARLGHQADLFPKLAPWHSTDIYAGMQKQGKQYFTFRTISDRNPQGWIHPGLEPRHFAQQVDEHIQNLMPRALAAALRSR